MLSALCISCETEEQRISVTTHSEHHNVADGSRRVMCSARLATNHLGSPTVTNAPPTLVGNDIHPQLQKMLSCWPANKGSYTFMSCHLGAAEAWRQLGVQAAALRGEAQRGGLGVREEGAVVLVTHLQSGQPHVQDRRRSALLQQRNWSVTSSWLLLFLASTAVPEPTEAMLELASRGRASSARREDTHASKGLCL